MQFPEFFSLKEHLAGAARTAFSSSDPGFREFELGLAALRDGDQMANAEDGHDPALLLLRSAIRLLVRATVLRRGLADADVEWAEAWSTATTLPEWPALEASLEPSAMAELIRAVDSDELYLAKLPPPARKAVLASMTSFAKRLAAPLEHDATSVARFEWTRRRRIGTTALLLVGALTWSIVTLTREANLALHCSVVVSDKDPEFGVDPQQVVDGDRSNLGFHTTSHRNSTVTIDLGAVKRLSRVDVYNRADCCQKRALPLLLQVSTDGHDFRTVSRRARNFDLWTVPVPPGTSARFVRLFREGAEYFHLAEIEVY